MIYSKEEIMKYLLFLIFTTASMYAQQIQVVTSQGQINIWDSEGNGPAVLFIHGNSQSGRVFKKQFESRLGQQYRLLAPDLPGHGDSDKARDLKTYSLKGYAQVLAEVIQQLKLEHVVVIGCLLGGHIALEMSLLLTNIDGVMITGAPPIVMTTQNLQQGFLPFNGFEWLTYPHRFTYEQARYFTELSCIDCSTCETDFIIEDAMKTEGVARACMTVENNSDSNDGREIVRTMHVPLAVIVTEDSPHINNDYVMNQVQYGSLWRQIQVVKNSKPVFFWEAAESFNKIVSEFLMDIYS